MRVSQNVAALIGFVAGGLVFLAALLMQRNTGELRAVLLVAAIWGVIVWGIMRLAAWISQETRVHPSSRIDGQVNQDVRIAHDDRKEFESKFGAGRIS